MSTEIQAPLSLMAQQDCPMHFTRISGYRNIRPLLTTEQRCESPKYDGIKEGIARVVEGFKAQGIVFDASVYLRDFKKAEWTAYNGDQRYEPASLLKVPLLMTYLRMAEREPGIMSRKLTLPLDFRDAKPVNFHASASIEPGRAYSVEQLLDYAITKSDNLATYLLNMNVEDSQFHHTYTDLGLADFTKDASSYPLSAKEYSVFMKALYNATYLSIDDSELAISLLMRGEFDQGLTASLPDSVPVAHKFGEAVDPQGLQLHEAGIVYLGNDPYLIVVMTKGRDIHQLPQVLSAISRYVFEEMMRLSHGPA